MKKLFIVALLLLSFTLFSKPTEYIEPFEYTPPAKIADVNNAYISDVDVYIMDGGCIYSEYNTNAYLKQIGDRHYTLTVLSGNFSGVTYVPQLTTIGFERDQVGVGQWRGMVISKTDTIIEFITGSNVGNKTIRQFYIQRAYGHSIACRNKFLAASDTHVDPERVWAGTIMFPFGFVGLAEKYGFEISSNSNMGMNDEYNNKYSPQLSAIDNWHFNAHGHNTHQWQDNPSYIGYIFTVSYSKDDGINHGSYGPGLEAMYPETCQSYATPTEAAIYAKLRGDYPDKTMSEIRLAVNKTASFDKWQPDGGYGDINYALAFAELSEVVIPPPPIPPLPIYIIEAEEGWFVEGWKPIKVREKWYKFFLKQRYYYKIVLTKDKGSALIYDEKISISHKWKPGFNVKMDIEYLHEHKYPKAIAIQIK